jgi:hypothetical protein
LQVGLLQTLVTSLAQSEGLRTPCEKVPSMPARSE